MVARVQRCEADGGAKPVCGGSWMKGMRGSWDELGGPRLAGPKGQMG
jgi:hypothetical protein